MSVKLFVFIVQRKFHRIFDESKSKSNELIKVTFY